MTPKCGRIDVEYANCSYHTRIGLGKWRHDPTLILPYPGGCTWALSYIHEPVCRRMKSQIRILREHFLLAAATIQLYACQKTITCHQVHRKMYEQVTNALSFTKNTV